MPKCGKKPYKVYTAVCLIVKGSGLWGHCTAIQLLIWLFKKLSSKPSGGIMTSGAVNLMLDSVSVENIVDHFCSQSSCYCSTLHLVNVLQHILECVRLHSTFTLHLQQMSCYTLERELLLFPGAIIAGTAVGDLCSTATSSTEPTDNGFWF